MNAAAIFNLYKSIVPPVYANDHIAEVLGRLAAGSPPAKPDMKQDEADKSRLTNEAVARATELAGRGS